jgi:hypothetical protein
VLVDGFQNAVRVANAEPARPIPMNASVSMDASTVTPKSAEKSLMVAIRWKIRPISKMNMEKEETSLRFDLDLPEERLFVVGQTAVPSVTLIFVNQTGPLK